jgi:DNA-binding GntR family transcriptional regulator
LRLHIPENLTQQAHRLIREDILTGKLGREQRLTEEFFAHRFHISKSPVREALNRLEAEGLVEIVPRRGAFVVDPSRARTLARSTICGRCSRGAPSATFRRMRRPSARLRASVRAAEKYFRANDRTSYAREDARFHTLIAAAGELAN